MAVLDLERSAAAGVVGEDRGAGRNRRLARSLADSGFGEFRRQLGYRCEWYGSRLLVAECWFPSSKRCSGCGTVKPDLALSERTYRCQSCGLAIDRDLNAAINLAGWAHPAVAPSAGDTKKACRAHRRSSASLADGCETGTGTAQKRPGSTRTPPPPAHLSPLEERFVDTALSRAVADRLGLSLGEFHRQQQERIPLGRLCRPEDIAGVIASRPSEEASHVSGQVLHVNGGRPSWEMGLSFRSAAAQGWVLG